MGGDIAARLDRRGDVIFSEGGRGKEDRRSQKRELPKAHATPSTV
jgi:hypothetical protein